MLSKIKAANLVVSSQQESLSREQPSAASRANNQQLQSPHHSSNNQSDTDDDHDDEDNEDNASNLDLNDSNNNNNNNNNLNNNNQPTNKKNKDKLLDIVEVSRKRRLSKESADSLTSFIRWSFSHIDSTTNQINNVRRSRRASLATKSLSSESEVEQDSAAQAAEVSGTTTTTDQEVDTTDWATLLTHQQPRHLAGGDLTEPSGSSAINLAALVKSTSSEPQVLNCSMDRVRENNNNNNNNKRIKSRADDYDSSPEFKYSAQQAMNGSVSPRKSSSYLGNVVERLHQQQQQQLQLQQEQQQQKQADIKQQLDAGQQQASGAAGLSFHLQQFLQQQTSLGDLCSSVGLDDSNQLVLAAAIHRALVDGSAAATGGNGSATVDAKSIAPSGGGPNPGHTQLTHNSGANLTHNLSHNNTNHHHHNHNHQHHHQQQQHNHNHLGAGSMSLADSLRSTRRTYNTRAALHAAAGLTGATPSAASALAAAAAAAAAANQHRQTQSVAAAMSLNNHRAQQQRHAQAAAALSALAASAGSNHHHHHHLAAAAGLPHSQQQNVHLNPLTHQHHHQLTQHLALGGVAPPGHTPNSTPMVDFKCDTCPSSFDDRHRLMQHQSIHLELKKDWFTETPVDEVMKIFNRRRGEFLCNICNLRFEATLDYDQHNHQVHGPRPYCCQFCGNGTRTFKCWRQYLNHLYDHRYIFSCTIDDCDFTVNRRDSLRFHIFRFHLNCQLPQNQYPQLGAAGGHMSLVGGGNNNNNNNNNNLNSADSKWQSLEEEEDEDDDDTENEMNVAD